MRCCVANRGQLGAMGEEALPKRMVEFWGLGAKMYAVRFADGADKAALKGVPYKCARRLTCDDYARAAQTGEQQYITFAQMRSRGHVMGIEKVTKRSLAAWNDKVYQVCSWFSRPHGHWRNLRMAMGTPAALCCGDGSMKIILSFLEDDDRDYEPVVRPI